MMEKMSQGTPPSVGKFKPEQIARQGTWTVVPELDRVEMNMHRVHIVPSNSTTLTYVNPLDPGDEQYYDPPALWDVVTRTRTLR